MKKAFTVLIAEDDEKHRNMLETMLRQWGYSVRAAKNGLEAVEICAGNGQPRPDLALLDVRMPEKDGIDALREIKAADASLPVIIMTAYSEIPAAVKTIRLGAYDYLTKPLDFEKLGIALRNALAHVDLVRENESLTASLADACRPSLIGASKPMQELRELIGAIAPTEATVLVYGESGAGKELAARAVHNQSRRAKGPFVAINCGALTEQLLASELFGHEKGAFTGADRKRRGLFLEASGGSIFLDEIGEMPNAMQVKLLRVLQEREILSVGGNKPEPMDCRVIAATNRDLAKEVATGGFRQDLYYRLNVFSLRMPSLRERKDDIPLLARHFATRFALSNNRRFSGITPDAMSCLVAWNWPGNVRELENVMERAIILMPGEFVDVRQLPDWLLDQPQAPGAECQEKAVDESLSGGREREARRDMKLPFEDADCCPTLEDVERMVILRTLKKLGNNKTEAARVLGISRKTLHAKLNRYGGNG